MPLRPLDNCLELAELVAAFEQQRLTHLEWDHRAHLAVAAAYVHRFRETAFERFKEGLLRLNASHGVVTTPTRGYHETITVAWIRLIGGRLEQLGPSCREYELVDDILESYGDKLALLRYYTRDRLMSLEARYGWVEPDLEPLPRPLEPVVER